MAKRGVYRGTNTYVRRAFLYFTMKYQVRTPREITDSNPERMREWCELLGQYRERFGVAERE